MNGWSFEPGAPVVAHAPDLFATAGGLGEPLWIQRVAGAVLCVVALVLVASRFRRSVRELLTIGGALGMAAAFAWWVDDSWITFHYVRRLLDGEGLVFNTGERVQGFTHPLWLLAVAALSTVLPIPYAALALGMLCTGALLLVLARLADQLGTGPLGFSSVAAFLFSSTAFLSFSTSGLEGSLLHALVAATALAAVRERPRLGPVVLLASLSMLTRLDAAATTLPFVALALSRGAKLSARAALACLPLVGWLVFAAYYFGFPLPNTFYAKTGEPALGRMLRGVGYLLDAALAEPLVAACVGLALARAVRAWRDSASDHGRTRGFQLAAGAAVAAQLAYVVWIGGDYMRGRFLTVALPLAALVVAVDLRTLFRGRATRLAPGLIVLAGLFGMVVPSPSIVSIDERAFKGAGSTWYGHAGGGGPGRARGGAFVTEPVVSHHLMVDAYGADPRVVWLDLYGLTDPFVARCVTPSVQRPGHVIRRVPEAYFRARGDVRGQRNGVSRLFARDPSLAAEVAEARRNPGWPDEASARAYRELTTLTRGPLDAPGRLGLVLNYSLFGPPAVPDPPDARVREPDLSSGLP